MRADEEYVRAGLLHYGIDERTVGYEVLQIIRSDAGGDIRLCAGQGDRFVFIIVILSFVFKEISHQRCAFVRQNAGEDLCFGVQQRRREQ